MGEPPQASHTRFWNVFMDVVAPLLKTPRDVSRIANDLRVTWPAVAGEVDRVDFLALSALKLLRPKIYAGVRAQPEQLCGVQSMNGRDRGQLAPRYDADLAINDLPEREREGMRMALRRLFPRLNAIYSNVYSTGDEELRRGRHVASCDHFGTYFAFSLVGDVLPATDVARLLERADDQDFVQAELEKALHVQTANGSTRASLLLEELRISAPLVPEEKVPPLLSAVFAMADRLDVEVDEERGFMALGNNTLRIHWLCNNLVTERFTLDRREEIYAAAAKDAPFGWAMEFADRCLRHYKPRSGQSAPSGEPLTSLKAANALSALARKKVRAAAKDGALLKSRKLASLLFDWAGQSARAKGEVRRWISEQMTNDEAVVALAAMTISTAKTASMGWDGDGDRVARTQDRVSLDAYADILDSARLESRVDELLASGTLGDEQRATLERFKAAPRKSIREF
jgi:predicted KAP-like P-loop ATPase